MKVHMRRCLAALFLSFAALSCNGPEREAPPARRPSLDVKPSGDESGPSLLLSWQAQQDPLSSYHVFYVNAGKPLEIDSLSKSETAFSNPRMKIDGTNMESWPERGSQACFYVVANNNGVKSDPSDPVCITMQ